MTTQSLGSSASSLISSQPVSGIPSGIRRSFGEPGQKIALKESAIEEIPYPVFQVGYQKSTYPSYTISIVLSILVVIVLILFVVGCMFFSGSSQSRGGRRRSKKKHCDQQENQQCDDQQGDDQW